MIISDFTLFKKNLDSKEAMGKWFSFNSIDLAKFSDLNGDNHSIKFKSTLYVEYFGIDNRKPYKIYYDKS